MEFTVATWNVRRSKSSDVWDHLSQKPDILLLQETSVNEEEIQNRRAVWNRIGERHWGTGIVSHTYELDPISLFQPSHPGTLAIANALIPGKPTIQLISLYGQMLNDYSITTLHRMLSDLTPLIDNFKQKNIILAGDFNASLQWDERQANKSHKILFDRIQDFGFFDCLAHFNPFPIQTWRRPNDATPWQLDHFYASKPLFDNLKSCSVIENDLSDHNPIFAVFDL